MKASLGVKYLNYKCYESTVWEGFPPEITNRMKYLQLNIRLTRIFHCAHWQHSDSSFRIRDSSTLNDSRTLLSTHLAFLSLCTKTLELLFYWSVFVCVSACVCIVKSIKKEKNMLLFFFLSASKEILRISFWTCYLQLHRSNPH